MGDAATIALAFRYPVDGRLAEMTVDVGRMDNTKARREMERFLAAIADLTLSGWEELHTDTLDLSPAFAPYVGHAAWGENYQRGAFMADLNRAMRESEISLHGELPDHLDPILRFLDRGVDGSEEVIRVLPDALDTMLAELRKSSKRNPYRHPLEAARIIAHELSEGARKVST